MGETKYCNYTMFLREHGYKIVSSFNEFKTTKKISYECQIGHTTTLTHTTFANKKSSKDPKDLCTLCGKKEVGNDFDLKYDTILNLTGHRILTVDGRNVTYKCVTCNRTRSSTFSNLKKGSQFCGACIPNNKASMNDVLQRFEQLKLDENVPKEYKILNYVTNKEVTFRCDNDHVFNMSYSDFKRGRRCPDCAGSRRAKTNLGRYGVPNPFESAVIKEKIKETCLKKYGETHHMKVEEIRKKAEQTNMVKIGVKYSFHTPQSFEKIRKTCLLRYGVQFPLQSEFIQAKITQKWLEKIGAGRPMTNQKYWKQCMVDKYGVDHYSKTDQFKIDYANTCLDKYGVDHYSKTDQFKIDYANTCLDKYGVDHYSKTDQFKIDYANTCLDKYGVDHPMKTIEIFQKATRNSFCRKPFVYPSGRVDYILGYEGVAIFELLESYNERDIITNVWCIPTFKYKRVSSKARPLLNKEYAMSVYFPDILLPDKIIEVKSAYLYKRDKQNVIEKMKAVAQTGYKGELWVYKSHKKLWFKKEFVLVGEHIVITKI